MNRNILIMILSVAFLSLTSSVKGNLVLSNTATNSGRQVVNREISPANWEATPFKVQTNGTSYTIDSIYAEILDFSPAGTLFMEIWSVSSLAIPDISLERLILTNSTAGTKTFTSSITLSAGTNYFLVTGVENGGGKWWERINNITNSNEGDFSVDNGTWLLETGVSGGSIHQSYHSSNLGSSWFSDGNLGAPLRISINATAIPEPGTLMVILFGLSVVYLSGKKNC